MKRIYLDYAATTLVDKRVKRAMEPYFFEKFGNPSSLHFLGQEAVAVVDRSRETIVKAINADFREIIFTGSATEANNLALRGVFKALIQNSKIKNQNDNSKFKIPRLIVSAIEHESVLETARDLENEGVEVIYLPVDDSGFVDLKKLKNSLNENTILVSIMYANNEIGIIQPIKEIATTIKDFRKEKNFPLFHTDAVQAFQYLDCDIDNLGVDPVTHPAGRYGVDMMTLSAHKIYGPKGIGALYARTINSKQLTIDKVNHGQMSNVRSQLLSPLVTGGGQEFGLRSGTENVPAIVGFAKAVEYASNSRELEHKRVRELRDYFWQELKKIYPDAKINGIEQIANSKEQRVNDSPFAIRYLPNILNIYFPGHLAEDLLIKLDMAGIAVSSGSACAVRSAKLSHVLEALGFSEERIRSSIRFSFGRFTTKKELDEVIKRMRNMAKSKYA